MAAEISREEHKLLEAGHHDPKISDLATASARKDKITRLPAIPLTIFAPLLVIVSLICVLLPTFILLSEGSSTSTNTLSDNYLTTLMDKVSGNITNSVKVMFPVIEYLTSMPRVAATFATPNLTNMQTAPWGADLTRLHHKYGLDTIGCMQVFWKPGFSNATASVSPPSNATVQFNQLTTYNSPGAGAVIVKTDSNETNALAKVYGIHPTTYNYNPNAYLDQKYVAPLGLATLQQLGLYPLLKRTFWNALVGPLNTYQAYVTAGHYPTGASMPAFHCSAGIRVDSTWTNILKDNRPSDGSIIAMLNETFGIVASSSSVGIQTAMTGQNFDISAPDPLTRALQAEVLRTFTSFADAASESAMRYDGIYLSGYPGQWILLTKRVMISSYPNQDKVLVMAIPRAVVYETIESAWRKALRVSIGVAVGLAVFSGAVFVLVGLPLLKLAKVMEKMTTLDFSSLEKTNALDERSIFAEIRRVQAVFSTMVKAFAGGLKKNKEIVGGPVHASLRSKQSSENHTSGKRS